MIHLNAFFNLPVITVPKTLSVMKLFTCPDSIEVRFSRLTKSPLKLPPYHIQFSFLYPNYFSFASQMGSFYIFLSLLLENRKGH